MVMGSFIGKQEVNLKAITSKMLSVVMVRWYGQMEVNIKELGLMDFKTV